MNRGLKAIEIAAGVVILVVVLGMSFGLLRKGQDSYSSSSGELSNSLTSMSTSQYDAYDGATESGEGVQRMISDVFNDEDTEILVCCKDGSNFVYNGINVGKNTATVIALDALTGMPTYDATGKAFLAADASGQAVATISGAPASVMCSTGFNPGASVNTKGYISSTATYACSVQKDINGNVRRLTYVQK